jgi:hypothetical protein
MISGCAKKIVNGDEILEDLKERKLIFGGETPGKLPDPEPGQRREA